MTDTIESLRVELAEVERERDAARAEADVRSGRWCEKNRAEGRDGCGMCAWCCKWQRERADTALADCAEMRAALEDAANELRLLREKDGAGPYDPTLRARITVLLARTDLGRGMVAVPREMVERAAIAIRALLDHRAHRSSCARCDPARDAVADLDALLDGGKVKP